MNDKMREEFEAAVQLAFHQSGNVADLRKVKGQYVEAVHQSAWWGWKTSRESLVIELPSEDDTRCDTVAEIAKQEAYNLALGECTSAIEAAGLKVAP